MATLEELLALMPDNDQGLIDAADLREVITGVWDTAATLAAVGNARLDVLEKETQKRTVSGVWRMNFTPGANPGDHQVTCDTGEFGTATWMRFSDTAETGADFSHALARTTQVHAQERDNADNHAVWTATGPAVAGDGWHQLPVQFLSGIAGALTGRVDAIFVFTIPAAGE